MKIDEAFNTFNQSLLEKKNRVKSFKKEDLKEFGEFYNSNILECEDMQKYLPEGIAAVDGSNNSYGGADPNIIHFLRATYLPDLERERVDEVSLISPLIDSNCSPKTDLARLELIVGKEGLEKYQSKVLMMDGGLMRYSIGARDEYNELVQTARENATLLIGVIEDMKSRSVSEALGIDGFDREIFFGLLDVGEVFFLNDEFNRKDEHAISTFYFRPANDPMAISVDYPRELESRKKEAADIVRTLTFPSSRGVPLILDFVDKYCKITDRDMNYFIKKYISEDLKRLFLDQARSKRWL